MSDEPFADIHPASPIEQPNEECGWNELLYSSSRSGRQRIPWTYDRPNPDLLDWMLGPNDCGFGKRALVVGCGLGEDAELLDELGYDVVAFDVSKTAIRWCRERLPQTRVDYVVADVRCPPPNWIGRFGFVFDCDTISTLSRATRIHAVKQLSRCLVPQGTLLLIESQHNSWGPIQVEPWALTQSELNELQTDGLACESVETLADSGSESSHKFRLMFRRVCNSAMARTA